MNSFGINPAGSLSEENKAARTLLQLLKQEQDLLVAAKTDGLTALTEEKTKVVLRMSELATLRHQALASAGFATTEAGMKAWLHQADSNTIRSSWTELIALATSAKEMNRVNGMLITNHVVRNKVALNALKAAPQGGSFYGPDGQAKAQTSVRGLVIG